MIAAQLSAFWESPVVGPKEKRGILKPQDPTDPHPHINTHTPTRTNTHTHTEPHRTLPYTNPPCWNVRAHELEMWCAEGFFFERLSGFVFFDGPEDGGIRGFTTLT